MLLLLLLLLGLLRGMRCVGNDVPGSLARRRCVWASAAGLFFLCGLGAALPSCFLALPLSFFAFLSFFLSLSCECGEAGGFETGGRLPTLR